ncbi:MAG TPA: hypothetical protein PLP85_01045 [Alcaligenes sp.]|nr:hypothetical protein [Alcaligenes sp.]
MILSDAEIADLIALPKIILNPRARRKEQKGSARINYSIQAENAQFEIYVRQNLKVRNAFSCGLMYIAPNSERVTLMRCNGSDHPHGNPLEGVATIEAGCHIHIATQRYMEIGRKPEHFAEKTELYTDVDGALATLLMLCNVSGLNCELPSTQLALFGAHEP